MFRVMGVLSAHCRQQLTEDVSSLQCARPSLVYPFGRFMRTLTKFVLGASLTFAIPASAFAQRQGAIEIGGFGRYTKYMDTLELKAAAGGGGRAGIYVAKNWLLEMELSYTQPKSNKPLTGNTSIDTLTSPHSTANGLSSAKKLP